MEIYSFFSKDLGELKVVIKEIGVFFDLYKDLYIEAFNLTEEAYLYMSKFKKKRGGVMVEVRNDKKTLGFFTLSNSIDNFFELGDGAKLEKLLTRSEFATTLRVSCEYAINKLNKKGVFVYPNQYAVPWETEAGCVERTVYRRHVSLVFFGFVILLPIQVYKSKVHLMKKYFKKKIFRNGMSIKATRLKFRSFRICRKSRFEENEGDKVKIGILYEFLPCKEPGDPFLLFSYKEVDLPKIGYEYSDNSA